MSTDQDRWYTVGAFHGCAAHDREHGINYAAKLETTGPRAVEALLAAGDRAGTLTPTSHDAGHCQCYATLDIRAEDGDILTDFRCIPTADALAWWITAAELTVDMSDCEVDTPEAHARTYAWAEMAATDPVAATAILLEGSR